MILIIISSPEVPEIDPRVREAFDAAMNDVTSEEE